MTIPLEFKDGLHRWLTDDAIIYRVYCEEGETKVSDPYHRKDINHLMVNTLLTSPLFGMEDSRLDPANDSASTDDTYLIYKINSQLKEKLKDQKDSGKDFINDKDIDKIIRDIINENGI